MEAEGGVCIPPHTYRPHFGEPFLAAVGTLIVHVFTLQSDYSQRKARD